MRVVPILVALLVLSGCAYNPQRVNFEEMSKGFGCKIEEDAKIQCPSQGWGVKATRKRFMLYKTIRF